MDSEQTAVQDQTDFDSLVEQMVAGNSDAFHRIAEAYHTPLVLLLIRRFGGNPDRAEEAAQNAWVAAMENLSSFKIRYSPWNCFRGWLLRIATNKGLDDIKKGSKVSSMADDFDPADESLPIDERLELTEKWTAQSAAFHHCLQTLSPEQQMVVAMKSRNCRYEDMSNELGMPAGTIASTLSRARERLRNCMRLRLADEVLL